MLMGSVGTRSRLPGEIAEAYARAFAAQALNDYFVQSGLDHLVACSDEL
jgi:hypothetical protein